MLNRECFFGLKRQSKSLLIALEYKSKSLMPSQEVEIIDILKITSSQTAQFKITVFRKIIHITEKSDCK